MMKKIHLFYHPSWFYICLDAVLLLLSIATILWIFPLSTPIPFEKYWMLALCFVGVWMLVSYLDHRYTPIRMMRMRRNLAQLLLTTVITFGLFWLYIHEWSPEDNYSVYVLLSFTTAAVIIEAVVIIFIHAYIYAQDAEPDIEINDDRGPQDVLQPAQQVDENEQQVINQTLAEYNKPQAIKWMKDKVDIYSTNTHLMYTNEQFNFTMLPFYRFDTIINLMPLNQMRGINKCFGIINDRLPDNGRLIVCFEPQSARKYAIFRRYPKGISHIIYFFDYIFRRLMPKLFWTRHLYFDITNGKNRVLSPTEVLGRLSYCGFEIEEDFKIKNRVYVVARRKFRPKTVRKRVYGVFVKLNRVGKDGKYFEVYKLRTMHPYAEFIQDYIYKKNNLQEGGKFSHDTRVSTTGRLARKYWLDELPMFINFFRGEMKLVGVRPISKHYFSLYSPELQELRTHFKPGLLPPFYADMPKTLEEIQESELRYLHACEQNGTFRTDVRYFFRILTNIIFRGKRSH